MRRKFERIVSEILRYPFDSWLTYVGLYQGTRISQHGEQTRDHQARKVNPSVDAVLASTESANTLTKESPPIQNSRSDDMAPSTDIGILHDFEAPSQNVLDDVQQEPLVDTITVLLNKQRVRIQYPSKGFWERDGEIIEYDDGRQALKSFMLQKHFSDWSSQLLYQDHTSTLYALPPWVMVDRQKFSESWARGI